MKTWFFGSRAILQTRHMKVECNIALNTLYMDLKPMIYNTFIYG